MLSRRLSASNCQVETRMIRAMAMPITGSIQFQPVKPITMPDTTTPTETSVSASMCR